MTEMILNDLAFSNISQSMVVIRPLLADVAVGISRLIAGKVVRPVLRMSKHWQQYSCGDGDFWAAIISMLKEPRVIDEARLLMRLTSKLPLTADLSNEIKNRFLCCEPSRELGVDGNCLVLCAILDGVVISLPIHGKFDAEMLDIKFSKLEFDGEIEEIESAVFNLAREIHAGKIISTLSERERNNLSLENLWANRESAFPDLKFGLDVEEQLNRIDGHMLSSVITRLTELNNSSKDWAASATRMPSWHSKVTPETPTLMADPTLRNKRVFRNSEGNPQLYEWHARCGWSYRIHIYCDTDRRKIEIGYIGDHLPT